MAPLLSVVIPALNAARHLPPVLAALVRAAEELPLEIVLADGGSTDATVDVAVGCGARIVRAGRGRGTQLAAGADSAEADWLFFLHADTIPGHGWTETFRRFMAEPSNRDRAAVLRFALDDPSASARRLEAVVGWRTRRLGLPYGDQGLLISSAFYRELGGYKRIPIMEDVDLVRRIGRRRLVLLDTPAVTSADRYRHGGWILRPLRNLSCLGLYFAGLPPRLIARLYAAPRRP
ncbi:MAG: TIGR04283 family arsenosugar biosynthesis glycosyltransferase [Alphaproteobacteria bacterium]